MDTRTSQTAPTSARRILVADDDPVNRRLAGMLLGRAGHVATIVEDGLAAVEAALGRAFDLILLDINMPGLTGLEVVERIRAAEAASGGVRARVLALTGHSGLHDRQCCLDAGMDGVVVKPLTLGALDGWLA